MITLKEAIEALGKSGVDSPEYDARELFRAFGNLSGEIPTLLTSSDSEELAVALSRRMAREPLQYIIGNVGFYREEYKVTPDCLIPRPDTEILVERAIELLPEGALFLDLCTGSGCVALSVLNNTKNTRAVAVDISDGALATARENAESLGLSDRVEFIKADVLEEMIEGDFFAVLSNPPYVSESAYRELEEEIYREPKLAFVGGRDGVDFYEKLTPTYRSVTERGGFIAYEIGYDQGEALRDIANRNDIPCEIVPDLAGRDRVAILRK